jgi:hypothetical protein
MQPNKFRIDCYQEQGRGAPYIGDERKKQKNLSFKPSSWIKTQN